MRYTQTLAAIVLGAVLAVPAAYAQFTPKAAGQQIDNADAAAMKQLAQANLSEIEGGKAAAAKAQSPDVKQFAQKMVNDHQQMLNELETLAKAKGVALPQSASLKDKAEQKLMERASGADFDKKYMEEMVKDHQKDAQDTLDLAAKAKDPDFRAAVQKAHAKIQEHLQLAQRIASQHGAAAGGTAK
jgi:putative membrane protein